MVPAGRLPALGWGAAGVAGRLAAV